MRLFAKAGLARGAEAEVVPLVRGDYFEIWNKANFDTAIKIEAHTFDPGGRGIL